MEVILFENFGAAHADSVRRFLPSSAKVLRTECLEDATQPTIVEFLIGLARNHNLLPSWQTTLLSHQEFFESLKVVCARLNQEEHGNFSVSTSDVISAQVNYFLGEDNPKTIGYKAFLKECNVIDQFGLLRLLEKNRTVVDASLNMSFIIEGTLRTDWHKSVVNFLAKNKILKQLQVELPVDGDCSEILENQIFFENVDILTPKDVPVQKHSQSLSYALAILKSFLNLLVNSRDEVSISCALACPLVNLGHTAFTIIKRSSSEVKSPIYQFVQSYVMKKRLGGRGYAPVVDCPVKAYLKEMTEFIDIMDRLQTFIEEYPAAVALNKIVNCVLTRLSKSIQQKAFKSSMVDKAREIVHVLIERVNKCDQTDLNVAPGIVGREAIQMVRTLADQLSGLGYHQKAAKVLCSPFSAATPSKTPVGSQTLFRLFKSPEEVKEDGLVSLAKRAPLPVVRPNPVMSFSVRYEPEPMKRFTDDLDAVTDTSNQAESGAGSMEPCNFITRTVAKTEYLTIRKANISTPVLKRSVKRKEVTASAGLKKKLKLVSANDPENQLLKVNPEKRPKKASKTKQSKNAVPPNQRTLNAFFVKL
ncbi:PCNA-interacting partner-like [Varroa jacobsoni]|uniref:PCNA-interacting partner-like n=1 Tax=Varroa jacobsoni TaxID=62625 RepID=UPI000BF8DDB3|nr:PCNA-interacting partner-like [Varroa jacobsoni]